MRSFAGVHLTANRSRRVIGVAFGVLSVVLSPWGDLNTLPTVLGLPATLAGGLALLACLVFLLDWEPR